ncbi:DCC1-like thiol-disulfide oxidoreductase family protein [Methylococcus sp. EFPC2]|uniref:DCC1-like thiol-disulfide oxidoreductase family protein n=1 Tax=Methylococcus sp. EFPC2 TaxID=2812648 RepID=UPI0019678527|nr:DCC1-like thiol-disulfide oxidoreductase family protein [Methylococcus sp. EFPC2]QSA97183.1 DUF393 domain-containing protein [Methylococcus sp. EFPC2]
MIPTLRAWLERGLAKQVPATGLAVFRILFGLVALAEILFLAYFRHLIFDRVPFLEPASPVVDLFLAIWAVVLTGIILGYHTRAAAIANYLLWLVFVGFTPMWLDFDGGFDQMMIGISFLMLFLPSDRALSLDNLRRKLKYAYPGRRYEYPRPLGRVATQQPFAIGEGRVRAIVRNEETPQSSAEGVATLTPTPLPEGEGLKASVSVLCYTLPLAFVLGLLYLDAGIHKLSAEFWRNGMGSWLPPTHPYYMSGLDMSWLLDNEWAERLIGYTLIVFQFLFLPLMWFRWARVPLLLIGASFHTGIIVSLNIYQFGFGMLAPYALLVPFSWWRTLGGWLQRREPVLTVFYDGLCPLCNRTVIVLSHFDIFRAVAFKDLQTHAANYPALAAIPESTLLTDLYALDRRGQLHSGVDTYLRILTAMVYPAPLAWIIRLPGLYHLAKASYRRIADTRARLSCDESCAAPALDPEADPWARLAAHYTGTPRRRATRLAKCLVLIGLLQLNSTLQFGVFYRLNEGHARTEAGLALEGVSNAVLFLSHTFLGITPHALYMHDHFVGYTRILGLTWKDKEGVERWLPFVNEQGRIVAPNWGRIQCWWANIAVTPHIKRKRLDKALMQITAFWGTKEGLDLNNAQFVVKEKYVKVPMDWEAGLRGNNLEQPWHDVGAVIWRNQEARIDLPGLQTGD